MCLWPGVKEHRNMRVMGRRHSPGNEFIFPQFSVNPLNCFNQVSEQYYLCGKNGLKVEESGHMNIERFW